LADDWSLVLELLAVECDVLLFVVAVAVDFVVLSFESLFPELQAAKTNSALNKNKNFFIMKHLHPNFTVLLTKKHSNQTDSSVLTLFTIHDVETNFFRAIRPNAVHDRADRFGYSALFSDDSANVLRCNC
jgi:hypothetical protein